MCLPDRRILAALDTPECGCRADDVCPHAALAPDHGLSLEEWLRLIELLGRGYDTPPCPEPVADVYSRDARIAVMAARQRLGLHLYHPDDSWRPREGVSPDGVSESAETSPNGRPFGESAVSSGEEGGTFEPRSFRDRPVFRCTTPSRGSRFEDPSE